MYRIDSRHVVHETFDGETVLVNLDSGIYYSLDGVGVDVWMLIDGGNSFEGVIEWIANRYDGERGEMERALHQLINDLRDEDLIVIDETGRSENIVDRGACGKVGPGEQLKNFVPPVLRKYTDMQDLLLLDPIHDVDEAGWPSPKDDLPISNR